jgi:hypothetical protein
MLDSRSDKRPVPPDRKIDVGRLVTPSELSAIKLRELPGALSMEDRLAAGMVVAGLRSVVGGQRSVPAEFEIGP